MRLREGIGHTSMKEIERFLRQKHAELKKSARSIISTSLRNEIVQPGDSGEWAMETLRGETQVALLDSVSHQLAQIEAALVRLSLSKYGTCQDCGAFIGLSRLRALPFALRCTTCESLVER